MPLVRIALRQGKPAPYRRAIAAGIHQAMVETIAASSSISAATPAFAPRTC